MNLNLVNASPPLLTRDQAAKYLGISSSTLAVWASTHRYHLPFVKIGSLCKYRQQDLDDFIARNTVGKETLQ
jgi:excisionase family DNA binding protein